MITPNISFEINMQHSSRHLEGPSPSVTGSSLQPVIITADPHFHHTLITAIPDLQPFCIHAASLDHALQLSHEFGDKLLLFIDIDSYEAAALIRFMGSRHALPNAMQVVGISDCRDLNIVINYLKAGFNGYVLKQEVNAALPAYAGNVLLQQGFPLSPLITQQFIHDLVMAQPGNYTTLLSKRELEILKRLMNGSSYKLIAGDLQISIETVRFHAKNIYRKLDVNSKSELVVRILHWPNASAFMH